MSIITDAIVDLADCHTTLYYLGQPAPANPRLPLTTSKDYIDLLRRTQTAPRPAYEAVAAVAAPVLLKSLSPAYHKNKYWDRFVGNNDFDMYSGRAWERIIPFELRLRSRVEFAAEFAAGVTVRPVPRVLLYPFGWSAWLSVRLTGSYTIEVLARFISFILENPVFKIVDETRTAAQNLLSLDELFRFIARGVRTDAFAGLDTNDDVTGELIGTTTVLAKSQGSVPTEKFKAPGLLRIVKPSGPPPSGPPDDYLVKRGDFQYLLMHDDLRFIWLESLLVNEGRNHSRLRCYHNNNFRSLVQARQLFNLLGSAKKAVKPPSPALTELVTNATNFFADLPYKNASLKRFMLDHPLP